MRIAFVVGSLSGGGAERVVSVLASEMADKGNVVKIILIASNKVSYPLNPNVEIADCSKQADFRGLGFLKRISMIKKEINNFEADITVSFTVAVNIYVILACMFSKRKLIVCERNDPRFDPTDKISRFMRTVIYRLADGYVFQTIGERDYFSNKIRGKSVVIPNPLSTAFPEPYVGVRTKRIVSAGRLQKQKNYYMAIEAFSAFHIKYPDYVYEIYGDGQLKAELMEYAKKLGVENSVIFKGSSRTLYSDILDATAFILTSDYEGISNAMLEAMALGIPVISTDYPSGGAREFITDGVNGFLVPVGCVENLTEKLILLVNNEKSVSSISREAYKIRDVLNADRICKQWFEYFEKITSLH